MINATILLNTIPASKAYYMPLYKGKVGLIRVPLLKRDRRKSNGQDCTSQFSHTV